jgi:hypothetical protein
LKVKSVKCTKKDPRILLDSDEYPECVETTPMGFGPVTTNAFRNLLVQR